MTRSAILIAGIGQVMVGGRICDAVAECGAKRPEGPLSVVALEAQRENSGTRQQPCVHGAVGLVTCLTSVYAHGTMFEYERPTFVGVAFEAGFFVRVSLLHHARPRRHAPGCRESSVGVMTIGTLDHAFIHAMLER